MMTSLLRHIILMTSLFVIESKKPSTRVVQTKYGLLRGIMVHLNSKHLDPVETFLGVPYASAPIGNLRFMPPVTPAWWSSVKRADTFSPVCPQRVPEVGDKASALEKMPLSRYEYLRQLVPYLRNQSEDCLYMNIYVPANTGKSVYILGQGY